jgi:small basic protein (TIGR04137 family)
MSIDRSLRSSTSLVRHRNVLTRSERVAKLMGEEKWPEQASPIGMPKVGHRRVKAGGKKKKSATGTDGEES